ncbi:MAG: NAD-dependent epimerase/dehydratase family protein [Acidobacteria bacterium]|nr:NAD-dependent epimerase/dehydratase family protein [Acidobacteriota bacterium]MBI3278287.1 NAD-dependent epimerase/dehydratase family protein [Acidobacteriota bacterium]
MKPVLVTGATGFLGKHLVEQLRERGAPLRLLGRASTPWDGLRGIETLRGDILSYEDVARAVGGAGWVYHLAGVVSRDPKDDELLYRVHIDGTRHVCEAALRAGCEKVIVVSSSGTIAVSREPVIHDENSGYKHDVVHEWAYYVSKIYAEKAALWFAREQKLPVVVISPALLLGPGDDRGSSTGDLEMFLKGELRAIPLGGMSFVDARDAAEALIGAMERGRPGERYLLGGPNWTFEHIIRVLSEITGVKPPRLKPSLRTSLRSARLLRRAFRAMGRSFEGLDDASIRMSSLFWYCDSSKAEREIGFRARGPVATLHDTVEDIRRRRN